MHHRSCHQMQRISSTTQQPITSQISSGLHCRNSDCQVSVIHPRLQRQQPYWNSASNASDDRVFLNFNFVNDRDICLTCPDDMLYEEYTLAPDNEYPFFITAKRYPNNYRKISDDRDDGPGTTLVCLHSTSFHKETWEPTLSSIFRHSMHIKSYDRMPSEAWVIECPNHGASAVLNGDLLRCPEYAGSFTCDRYARAAHRFLNAKYFDICRRDKQTLVGLGHSLGGVAMIILQSLFSVQMFRELIIVEPMISPLGQESLRPLRDRLVKRAHHREDSWPDRHTARLSLEKMSWDSRVLDLYVKYALRNKKDGTALTLCCSKFEEAAMYQDVDGPIGPVSDLNVACAKLAVHIILGKVNDLIPNAVQNAIVDPSSPRCFKSISYIENVGHLVPQQAPDALATKIISLLDGEYDRDPISSWSPTDRSKL